MRRAAQLKPTHRGNTVESQGCSLTVFEAPVWLSPEAGGAPDLLTPTTRLPVSGLATPWTSPCAVQGCATIWHRVNIANALDFTRDQTHSLLPWFLSLNGCNPGGAHLPFFSAPGQPRRPTTRTIRLMGEQSGSTGEPVLRLTNAHIQKNTRMRIHRGPSRQWWWRYRGDVTHDAWLTPSSLKTIFLFSGAQAWLLGRVR